MRYASLPERGVPEAISQTDALEWSAVLRSCSAWDAYKSLHGADVHPRLVAEFLLFNEDFPRSVRFCVGELNRALRQISGVPQRALLQRRGKTDADGWWRNCNSAPWRKFSSSGLHQYLDQLQVKLNDIGGALFNAYIFQHFNNEERR